MAETPKVYDLGENKAITRLTFTEGTDGGGKLGVVVFVPSRQEGGKTYYTPIAVEVGITSAQREGIVNLIRGNANGS